MGGGMNRGGGPSLCTGVIRSRDINAKHARDAGVLSVAWTPIQGTGLVPEPTASDRPTNASQEQEYCSDDGQDYPDREQDMKLRYEQPHDDQDDSQNEHDALLPLW